jgi:hypothetical protein
METHRRAMEAEKAAVHDKSAKAAVKYCYDFLRVGTKAKDSTTMEGEGPKIQTLKRVGG